MMIKGDKDMDILDKSLLQNPGYMAQRVAACELEIQKGMIEIGRASCRERV